MKKHQVLHYGSAIIAGVGLFLALSSHSLHHSIGFAPDDHTSNIVIGILIFLVGTGAVILTAKKA